MPNVLVVRNEYPDQESLGRVLNYVQREPIGGGYAIDPNYAFEQMMLVKNAFYKTEGVQLKHFIVSFTDSEMGTLDFTDLINLGFEIGKCLQDYQMVYSIHLDSNHTHMHFVMNTVSFLDGHKYGDGLSGFKRICTHLKEIFPKSRVGLFQTDSYNLFNPYTQDKKGVFQDLN